ncbi:hypothetical protein PMAYCL1PPCAC_13084, partial [Pristionchus mayeri]
SCLHQSTCVCDGDKCTSDAAQVYILARMYGSILQEEKNSLSLYRYSIYAEHNNVEDSPEKYAMTHKPVKATAFNPRIHIQRQFFNHIRRIGLAIACLSFLIIVFYRRVSRLIEKLTGKKKKSARPAQPRCSREVIEA